MSLSVFNEMTRVVLSLLYFLLVKLICYMFTFSYYLKYVNEILYGSVEFSGFLLRTGTHIKIMQTLVETVSVITMTTYLTFKYFELL